MIMYIYILMAYLHLSNKFLVHAQSNRIIDQIYVSFSHVRYCVRRLNSTHEIGCQSNVRGNVGRMYMIENDQEFMSFIENSKFIDSTTSFIIVMNVNLFDSNHVDHLMKRLDRQLNGILLYFNSNSSRPAEFSHDEQCPNFRQSFHFNQTENINWNPKGTGLFFRSFPFPIMLIDGQDESDYLIELYKQCQTTQTSAICGLELNAFQNAAHTTKTCMRRNDISHALFDFPEVLCDPVSGLNIYSKLPHSITIKPNKRPPKSVILILVGTDSFQMFLKSKGSTGGTQQPAIALITFLSLAHLIGQEQNEFQKQDKEIMFVTLDGDALDYSASFKFMFDMNNGYFPSGSKNEQIISVEHIHSVIELQSLSMTDELWLHTYPSTLIDQQFIHTLLHTNPMINLVRTDSPLPPASSQIFLRQSSLSFPVYILSSINRNSIPNHYYHSFLDDPSTVSINISTLEYNTETKLSQWIKNIVEPLAQTFITIFTGLKKNATIKQEIINNLIYCILKNINCPLIHNVTDPRIGRAFQAYDQMPMPFSINTYPTSMTPTFSFIQNVLGYFLRDRLYDSTNFTESSCTKLAENDSFCAYKFVDGYLPSLFDSEDTYPGYCIRSYTRFVSSISPAFIIDDYDLSDITYPAWTESRWATVGVRFFLIPTRTHETITLIIGILLTSISFIFLFFLRHYRKIGLLQPSSS